MFLLTVEWFGLPDDLKKHTEQLEFGFKGKSNDELRQTWMSTAVPLCAAARLRRSRALRRRRAKKWVVDCAFPATFDERKKRWLLEDGAIAWDEVMVRWKQARPQERPSSSSRCSAGNSGLARLPGEEVA